MERETIPSQRIFSDCRKLEESREEPPAVIHVRIYKYSSMAVSSLKKEDSLIAAGEEVKARIRGYPRRSNPESGIAGRTDIQICRSVTETRS